LEKNGERQLDRTYTLDKWRNDCRRKILHTHNKNQTKEVDRTHS